MTPTSEMKTGGAARRWSAISNEPLVNSFQRHLPYLAAVLYALGLVYTCLVPFEFSAPTPRGGSNYFWGLRVSPGGLIDIISNITIYVPLGAMLSLIGRRRGHSALVATGVSGVLAGLLSLSIETAQRFNAMRFPAWSDVTANSLGAILGAAAAAAAFPILRRAAQRGKVHARRSWWMTSAKVAVCAALIVQLRPFDVVPDLRAAAAKAFKAGSFDPRGEWKRIQREITAAAARGRSDQLEDLRRAECEYFLDHVADTALYATLAALVVLGRRRERRSITDASLDAGWMVLILGGAVTTLRIFITTHGFDADQVYCAFFGWPIGCLAGTIAARNSTRADGGVPSFPDRTLGQWRSARVLMWLLILFTLLYEFVPFDFSAPDARSLLRSNLIPFAAHFSCRTSVAVNDIAGDFLRYLVIGACLSVLCDGRMHRPWRVRLVLCVAAATGMAAVAELSHAFMASRHSDVTTVLIAAPASFTGGVAVRWVHDLRRFLLTRTADDLLTGQLIEGETYRPIDAGLAAPKQGKSVVREEAE